MATYFNRKLVAGLCQYRCEQLKTKGQEHRIAEVQDMFGLLDRSLSGIRISPAGGWEGPESKLGEVMMSADFTYAIQEFVERKMIPGYERKAFAFEPLIKPDTTPNFLAVTRYQKRAGLDDLELVTEKGAPRPGSVVDATKKQYRVWVWQKQFDFSMVTLVNDDIGYFNDQAADMGRAARRTLEKFVSRMYTNVTTINRLTGLLALYSTTGRLTSQRISEARMAFNQRVDDRAEPVVATLRYIVHHSGLIDQVRTIRQSQLVPELATNATNVVAGDFIPIEDPYIVGVAPNLPWYAFTDWRDNNIIPFVLARWTGMPAPRLDRKKSDIESFSSFSGGGGAVSPLMGDFATGNIVVKVVDAWGTYRDNTEGNMFDYRGCFYSSGTAA